MYKWDSGDTIASSPIHSSHFNSFITILQSELFDLLHFELVFSKNLVPMVIQYYINHLFYITKLYFIL